MSTCININNGIVQRLSLELGLPPILTAAKIAVWMEENGNKIPTSQDLQKSTFYQRTKSLTASQEKAKKIFFDKIYNQDLSELDIQYLNRRLKEISDAIGDTPWHVRVSSKGNYYIAGYKNFPVTVEGYYSPYANGIFRQASSQEGIIASEKTIRDLAARISDRIGILVRFESDRSKDYKGKLEDNTAVINLAYATLDTPIHEILGHPIIRAIKNRKHEDGSIEEYNDFMADYWDKHPEKSREEVEKYVEKNFKPKIKSSQLYQNLLKELETGRGKEVLDRIKRDYKHKGYSFQNETKISGKDENELQKLLNNGYELTPYGKDIYNLSKENTNYGWQVAKRTEYTLEEQQEEAIVELLGLMTAEKLDAVKDGKLISLLKRLLKEMKSFMKSLINQKEVEIDKLPDNMTIGDLSDLLAYSNSKLILPGYEVEYTTPDNMNFKTYQEASNHISQLAKSVEDVDLDNIKINTKSFTNEESLELDYLQELSGEKSITKEQEARRVELLNKSYNQLLNFIEKNKEYEQSKEIIEEWKRVNNIVYNPEEIYSRGQEFVSVVGAYSNFDINLMMQNLLVHIEDNEKAGGKFAISAFTKPIDRQIGHLEGGGGKIKFKIYPQSEDVLWAANTDVYSGSVWDASEKVSKDKKSELLGVSYSKYPSLNNVNAIQPNLASVVDDLAHHHNELGITLTGNNFRLEYDEDIPYQTKKIIDGINSILDQKYGKLVKPEIKIFGSNIYKVIDFDGKLIKTFDSKDKAKVYINNDPYYSIVESKSGIQPTQTKDNLKESINDVAFRVADLYEEGDTSGGDNSFLAPMGSPEFKQKEYTEQALINTKIDKLKEVAKKYPRSLIRSEVKIASSSPFDFGPEDGGVSAMFGDDLPFQKVGNTQQTVVQSLLSLQGKQVAQDTFYTIEGFTTKFKRPSAIAKAKIQGQEGYKTESLENEQDKFKALGTLAHDMMSEVIRRAFPSENSHRNSVEITPELSDLYAKMEKIMEPFIADAKSRGSVLMTEVFVANLKLERGGTIDLLEVLPDGNYITYDLKTRFKPDKSIKRRYNKIVEFSIQKGEYRNILQEGDSKLGIPKGKVVGSKIIEAPIKYNWKTFKIIDFGNIQKIAPTFLRTNDDKLNNFINRLQSQIEALMKAEPKNEVEKEAWNKLLYSKITLMQDLQLKQNVAEIVNHAIVEIEFLKDYIKNESELDTKKAISELEIYSNLQDFIDIEKLTEKEIEALKSIEFDARSMKKKLMDRSVEILKETATETGIMDQLAKFGMDLFGPILDDNWLRKMLTGVSNSQNPIVQTAFRKVTQSLGNVRNRIDIFAEELTKKIEEYEKYTGSRNYDIILNDSKTALVQEFDEEFYRLKKQKLREGDMEWAKDNMTYNKDKFEKNREEYLAFLDSKKDNDIAKIKASLKLKGQDEDLDISADRIYWANRKQEYQDWENRNKDNWQYYGEPKNKWKSQKWKDIKEGKYKGTPVEAFYDFYTRTMTEADIISPDYIYPSFIPNFSQDFIERAMQNGLVGAFTHQWSELLNNLDPGYDEALYGKIDPATGKVIPGLFIPGTSKYKQQKSLDLGKSLLMFMEGVYRFEEMSAIEDTVFNLKLQLEGLEIQKIDILGKPVSGDTKVSTEKNPSNNTLDQFNYFIDAVVYGKARDTEKGFKVTGNKFTESIGIAKKGEEKVIGYAKLVDLMIRYTGLRNLGINLYAPMTNLFAGKANQFITGAGGLYYGMDDIAKATNYVSAGKLNFPNETILKARLILDYLQIDMEKTRRNMKAAVTQNKLDAFSEKYNAMTFMRESESALVESGALAMVLSGKNGIKFEDFQVVDGKLVVPDYFTDMKKEIFRQKVYKVNATTFGSMNEADVLMAKKWMVGRMAMQHRSWLPQMFYKRFGAKRVDFTLDKEIEGIYWASAKVIKTLITKGVTQGWESLTPEEQAAFKQSSMEVAILISTGLMLLAMGGADDDTKKEAWFKYSKKILGRTNSELYLFLDPTLSSQWQILISPAATISTVEEGGRLIRDIFREVNANFYEDPEDIRKKAKVSKRAARMVPGYGQISRFLDDMFTEEPTR